MDGMGQDKGNGEERAGRGDKVGRGGDFLSYACYIPHSISAL